jgi:hypothetical protein
MGDRLYSISLSLKNNSLECSEWLRHESLKNPVPGLFDYGIEITEKGKIVLFGGVTNTSVITRRSKSYTMYSTLWIMDIDSKDPQFDQFSFGRGGAGFTKIISLGGEIVCLMNNQIVVLNIDNLKVSPMKIINSLAANRTGFSLVRLDESSLLIIGGYNYAEEIKELDSFLSIITFSVEIPTNNNPIILIISIASSALLMTALLGVKYRKKVFKKFIRTSNGSKQAEKSFENVENIHTEGTKQPLRNENTTESTIQVTKSELTMTLVNTEYAGIYTPGYKVVRMGYDFFLGQKLAEGAQGAVFVGKLMNVAIADQYNNGNLDCIIKIAYKSLNTQMFLQELSIHEMFSKEKYLAKLICFSEEPQTFVLKYYRYGTLNGFVFPPNSSLSVNCEYSLKNIFFIAEKLSWGYNLMHSRKIIHNAIKLDNILLDGDAEEPLYPVITDFGICKILDATDVVNGLVLCDIKAFTTYYAAPEVLYSFVAKHEKRKSNQKTDMYSFGVVLYELFTRTYMWKKFDVAHVISGGLPETNLEIITSVWREINRETASVILGVILDCLNYDSMKRPRMKDVFDLLRELAQNYFTNKKLN